jgi:isoprenylcysteine carboxyl methyltransferase (ICMT) family protein YpbQ
MYARWLFYIPFYIYLIIVISSIFEFFFVLEIVDLQLSILGFILYLFGVVLRREAISGLGEFWSIYTEIKRNQQFISSGLYKHFKHPYYLAVILELSGISLISNAYYSMVLVVFIQTPLLIFRVIFEERILRKHFSNNLREMKNDI